MVLKRMLVCCAAFVVSAGAAAAQEWYVGGSAGIALQQDSDNEGEFTSDFTPGLGADDVASGTSVGWTTDFETGFVISGEAGLAYESGFRGGLEVSYTQADVDTHTGVSAGGASIDEVDAAFLTGDADPLGATIADIVADGQGDISGVYVFANGYFDFNKAGPIQPYIGAGVGIGFIDVLYEPSGVGIVDDDQTKFAYQAIAGLTYDTGQNFEIFGQYNYRATEDVEVDVDLFPARLDIENRQHLLQAGVRFKFG